jgi:hypothetical protein
VPAGAAGDGGSGSRVTGDKVKAGTIEAKGPATGAALAAPRQPAGRGDGAATGTGGRSGASGARGKGDDAGRRGPLLYLSGGAGAKEAEKKRKRRSRRERRGEWGRLGAAEKLPTLETIEKRTPRFPAEGCRVGPQSALVRFDWKGLHQWDTLVGLSSGGVHPAPGLRASQ